ncbi:MAG: RluA family pseudouridine synthase [Pseudomonadaceae bacterium]|nr:RluA family pseudouridine synthase [Pseudomonadaceae bacterium]
MTMPQTFSFTVTEPGQRLDAWLTAHMGADMSRARIQQLIREHHLTRNGQVEANPARKVREGEVYMLTVPPIEELELQAEDIPLSVLFEDEHLLVINKPAGLAVHPSIGHESGTLVHALLHHCKDSLSGINGEQRPGIVHRLDMDTSGVMVAAKHDVAHRNLARQFARHSIHRRYLALVRGVPRPPSGTVVGSIGRHPVSRLKRAVVADGTAGSKPATTHYQCRQILGPNQGIAALVACTLETGRTHQIRVHMAHIGHPILGDKLYGNANKLKGFDPASVSRQMLHAAELGFIHPLTGEDMAFEAALPEDMQGVMGQLA